MNYQYDMAKANMTEMSHVQQGPYDYDVGPMGGTGLQGPIEQRSCTDLFCCVIFTISCIAFLAISGYGIATGKTQEVLGIYSYDGILCSNEATNKLAYMPYINDTTLPYQDMIGVVCVESCPLNSGDSMNCSGWGTFCPSGTASATYPSFVVGSIYCTPNVSFVSNISQVTAGDLTQAMDDTKNAQYVLIGAVVLALILGLFYFFFLRCCAGLIIWLSIILFIFSMIGVGVYMFLYTEGIEIIQVPFDLSAANKDSMRTASYILWGVSVLAIILTIVLYKTIKLAIAVIKCAAIYLADTCQIIFYPPLVSIALILVVAYFLVGLLFTYSTGTVTNTYSGGHQPYAVVEMTIVQQVMLGFIAFTGIWMIFFLNGLTNFVLSSSAAIWYFSNSSIGQKPHRPILTSISRAQRYHPGTIAFGSLVLGIFFIIRFLSAFFKSNPDNVGSNRCIQCCVKCLTCVGAIFNICMRFLTKGAFVQTAIFATSYCQSSLAAFRLLASNPIRLALSSGLSSLVTLLGKLAITFIVLIAAYYTMSSIEFFVVMVKNPVVPSLICALIAYAISNLYMSVYGTSCNAIIQCFLMDEIEAKARGQRARYCPEPLRQIIDDNTYNN